jgi:hypothetical protein
MFINKMGWSEYNNIMWRPPISIKNVLDSENVIYYIQPLKSEKTFLITESKSKQNPIKEYKFIIVNNKSDIDLLNSIQIYIKSNMDLMKLIKDFEACNEQYQRHFKLNKILK